MAAGVTLSDPLAAYDAIRKAGYYLGPKAQLGARAGEEGGPLLAWRDPFFFEEDGTLLAFWSAKIGPREPAIAWARLVRSDGGAALAELLPPLRLPDADRYTQAEVPKLYAAPEGGYLLLVSACDRVDEAQPASEVTKALHLYRAETPAGPWRGAFGGDSLLPGAEHLFGGAFIALRPGEATLLSPYSEMAPPELALTFAAPRRVRTVS